MPKVAKREKAIKITKELKEKKVYRTLRQEWNNARNEGQRQKRKAEAEKKD